MAPVFLSGGIFMSTLYVTEQGARVEKEYHRLLVTLDDEVICSVPMRLVTGLVLIGKVGVTTPAMIALLRADVPLFFVSTTGKLLGRLLPATGGNLVLRRKQYAAGQDKGFCLGIAKSIVRGKLRNQRNMVRRILRRRPDLPEDPAEYLDLLEDDIDSAANMGILRGIEGKGARAYFSVFWSSLEEGWAPKGRSRRPPGDPVNALLGLGYTFLVQVAIAALEIVGLDPYEGFFHADKYGRPALALDLVEEFRTPIVDSVVLTLINKGIIKKSHFNEEIRLDRQGWKIFCKAFAKRLDTRAFHPVADRSLSYRKIVEIQARQMRKAVEEGIPYKPYYFR